MRVYHRSGVETDWECPRRYYWNYEHDGRGIVPLAVSQPLTVGTVVHAAFDRLLKGEDLASFLPEVLRPLGQLPLPVDVMDPTDFVCEQQALVTGLLAGFTARILPRLLTEYEPVRFEKEVYYTHPADPTLVFVCRPDVIMRHRATGSYTYVEWKTVATGSLQWTLSWSRAVQLHAGAVAATQLYQLPVTHCLVIGCEKGRFQDGWQHSPWCYHWRHKKTGDLSPFYRAGWERTPNWHVPGYSPLDLISPEDLDGLYPMTQPIAVDETLVRAFFTGQAVRQSEIAHALTWMAEARVHNHQRRIDETMAAVFPQHFSKCLPSFGRSCEFERCCFTQIGADPMASGLYAWRTPHHPLEATARGLDVSGVVEEEG